MESSLQKITFGENSGIWISSGAFSNTKLQSIYIPVGVTDIFNEVFAGTPLTEITYQGTKEQWNEIYLDDEWNSGSSITKIICTDGTIDL